MIELHYGWNSGNSSRAVVVLEEAGVPYQPCLVDPKRGGAPGGNRAPGYLSVNPMGKIPALVDGELCLWESNAIALYALEKYGDPRLLGTTPEARAGVLRWTWFQTGHVSPACVPIFRSGSPRMLAWWGPAQQFEAQLPGARAELDRYLPVIEQALDGRDFLEGELSLGDLSLLPHLWLLADAGFDFSRWPRLGAWLARLVALPSWQRTVARVFPAATSSP